MDTQAGSKEGEEHGHFELFERAGDLTRCSLLRLDRQGDESSCAEDEQEEHDEQMGAEEEDKKEICIQVNMMMINLGGNM